MNNIILYSILFLYFIETIKKKSNRELIRGKPSGRGKKKSIQKKKNYN